MGNLRSQFKAQSIKSLRKAIDKDDLMVGVQNNDYLSLEDGKQLKIRIFPAHPGHENFYVARKCYWLSFTNNDGELKRGTVLDSIVHGGTQMDLIQEYVRYAKKKYGDDAKKMEFLTGTGKDSMSLNPQYSWLCYADIVKDGEDLRPKVWEFRKTVRDLLNKLAFSEDEDEPIEVDPFTDPDDGLPVLVKYLKNPNRKKGENYYEVNFAKKPTPRPLSDDELETFAKIKPLDEVIPRYSKRDFDRALEGLQTWDEEYDFNLFDDDNWLEIVENVKAQYDTSDDDNSDDDEPKKKTVVNKPKKVVEEVEEEENDEADDQEENDEPSSNEEDEFDDMDRTELKKYIKKNGLEVVVKKSMSDDDIRNEIRKAMATSEEADENIEEEEENEEPEEQEEVKQEAPKAKLSLAEIRAKLAKK